MLAIVIFTNFLDYLLLTTVVPIIPEYLISADLIEREHELFSDNETEWLAKFELTTLDVNATLEDVPSNVSESYQESLIERALRLPVRAISENSKVGWLLASKALVQLVVNPVIGLSSHRFSYESLLFFGTWIFLVSATLFAAAESYAPLLIARASQGVGSAATTIAGMSMIAERYHDDKERSRAMGFAMGGLALGILVGYPFGGLLYALVGKSPPFVGIALMCMFNIGLQYSFMTADGQPSLKMEAKPATLFLLLKDPYILICAGAIMITSMSLAVLESTVPLWIMDNMEAKQWQLGLIFLPDSIGYLIGTNAFPVLAKTYGRYLFTICSMLLIALGLIVIPFCQVLYHLLLPHLFLGLGVGVTDAAIMPLLALLVDRRHIAAYGSVYAIVQLSVCLAYGLGPAIAGQIVKAFGFKWSVWGMAICNIVFAPASLLLRAPTVSEEFMTLISNEETKDDELEREEMEQFYSTADQEYQTFGGKLVD